MFAVVVLHGPNLQALGKREPQIYGRKTLDELNRELVDWGAKQGAQIACRQSNHEGELVDWIYEAADNADGIVINPAAYTHTSVALRDALAATRIAAVEVHLSQPHNREDFRQRSLTSAYCIGTIAGFGPLSYRLGVSALVEYLNELSEAGR